MNNIFICGNYGATNLGDELILKGLLAVIPAKAGILNARVVVLSYNPKETERLHHVKSVYFLPCGVRSLLRGVLGLELFQTLKAYYQCNEFIFGGGGLMQDDKPKAIFIWGFHLFLALILRKRIRILGNSVGPLNKLWSRKIVSFLFNHVHEITIRDEISKKLLKEIGVRKEIKVVEDFASSLSIPTPFSVIPAKAGILHLWEKDSCSHRNDKCGYIILSLRNWLNGKEKEKFDEEIVKMCNFLIQEKGYEIIGIPFEKLRDDDEAYLLYIREKTLNKKYFHVQKYCSDFDKIFDLYFNAHFVIGMRLHSIILAHKFKKDFLALSYSEKVRGFCEGVGKGDSCVDIRKFGAFDLTKF
ncbi:MAG: polysaccharide pyruvyl transferase CsaB [Candidatus Peregrinibacteria bacterium GW2011_GWF2_33_10]|nr:MAG: polysaccharide pyruvyl transferase CsaB [Candidatus Peregrinibacteria bacterium GW2011_GWF2_33_10]OGJ45404.1 MAG: hypothetical protein A2263_04010 [Candidatus Peregrinibacteria bacterium RIFOXYA2_FULL_33_21]OGJ45525.1 MAG: hypothetical protein A2272_00930 [Candidatus Peregrinibacteria bacterium RIFOXYA12_FULL_33_12]OGJ51007.1 MAG: hypothetical protein A2307_05605 [Candidatus Peregrinibacteria bacterium RIFOXYB2_FULL_33_20]